MVLWLFPSSVGVLMLVYSFDLTDDAKLFSNYNLLFVASENFCCPIVVT
jgi:hypothetical protein